jgi:hypothetical protein
MAKGAAKQINRDATNESNRINKESSDYFNLLSGRMGPAQQRADESYGDIYGGFKKFLDPSYASGSPGFGEYEGMFKNLYNTGGLDAENIDRIRGKGGFDEFAKTGGYSTGDISNIRSRSNRSIPSFFDALRAKMGDQALISGTPASYTSSLSRMSRDQARQSADMALDTELGIKDRVNEGRRYGISGMSGAEQGLAELLSRNKIAGAEGGLRAAGMGAQFGENRDKNILAALGGMGDLRGQVPGEEFNLYKMMLENMGQRGGLYNANLGNRMQYNPNKSFMDYVGQIAKIVGPIAATVLTGGAAAPSLALMGSGGGQPGFTPTTYTPGGAASGEYVEV